MRAHYRHSMANSSRVPRAGKFQNFPLISRFFTKYQISGAPRARAPKNVLGGDTFIDIIDDYKYLFDATITLEEI